MNALTKHLQDMDIFKFLKWEFWPSWLLYFPVAAYLLVKGLLKGSLLHFLACNPELRFAGLVEYSKFSLLRSMPPRYVPASHYFSPVPDADEVEAVMRSVGIEYPIFLKPDMGERGRGVERLSCRRELERYVSCADVALILQEDIARGREYGVMLVRDPVSGAVRVTSLVVKEPLAVMGDGLSTLSSLIREGERSRYHWRLLERMYRQRLAEVPPRGEELVLVDIGNHARGSTFRNGNNLISPDLCAAFVPLMDCLPNFYLGRFDVKAADDRALKAGEFTIIEINGVNSEPAHIYELGLPSAWAALIRHWQTVSRISMANIERGTRPESLIALLRALRVHYLQTARGFRKFTRGH